MGDASSSNLIIGIIIPNFYRSFTLPKYPCYKTVMNYLIYPNNSNPPRQHPLLTPSKNRSFVRMYLSQKTSPI